MECNYARKRMGNEVKRHYIKKGKAEREREREREREILLLSSKVRERESTMCLMTWLDALCMTSLVMN